MNILLIDADSKIPNIPLMKLSTYHKSIGDNVELVRVKLPYFPNRKKYIYNAPVGFDKYYASVVFEGNKKYIKGDNIIFGGTGVDLKTILPKYIEEMPKDYTIYPDNNTSYGFISRGCIRKCYFCKVPEKEGYIHRVSTVDNIVEHEKVEFLDNNILALPEHKEVLKELINKNIKCKFSQGLDIRLIDAENSLLLSKLNYMGEYIFAFDNWKYRKIIEKKLPLLSWRVPWTLKFYVYMHPDMTIQETLKRIYWLKNNECLPYIMRDITCWSSKYNKFYIDIASYCNQPNFFKKISFRTFLEKRYKNKKRIEFSYNIYKKGKYEV